MRKRVDYFDIAKGIGILLVVAAHIYGNGIFRKLIYSFHMPLFLIISGMLAALTKPYNKPFLKLVWSRVKGLLLPYAVTEIICIPLFYLRGGYTVADLQWIVTDSVFLYVTKGSATWFLLGLFIAELIYFMIVKCVPNRWIVASICTVLFVVSLIGTVENHIIFNFLRSFSMVFFVMIGHQFTEIFTRKRHFAFDIVLLMVFVVSALLNNVETVLMVDNNGGNPFLFLLSALSGSALVITYSQKLSDAANRIAQFVKKQLVFWGQNTVIVLCSHLIIMRYGIDILLNAGPHYGLWLSAAIFLFVMAVQYVLIYFKLQFKKIGKKS